MPAIADRSLAVLTAKEATGSEAFVSAMKNAETMLSLSRKPKHNNPNVAVLVLAIKNTQNLSLGEFGENRRLRPYTSEKEAVFVNGDAFLNRGAKDDSWFSILANLKQGGRKTPLDLPFVAYLANALTETFGIKNAETLVKNADAEDAAIRLSFAKANK